MLEIPESITVAEQLNDVIKGKVVQNVYPAGSPHKFAFYYESPEDYQILLKGKQVGEAKAIAGYVEIEVGDARLLFGDGVHIRYYEEGERLPQKHQLHIEFEDYSSLVCTVSMYGVLFAYPEGKNDNPYYLVAKEKPSPLSDVFDENYFKVLLDKAKKNLSIKAFLATEQRIPGLGNGVLQDILFKAGINPRTKLNTLVEADKKSIFKSVKETLCQMTIKGGRNTEKDIFGVSGGYQTILSKNTWKASCPICGSEIVKQTYLGGTVYYCPVCQPFVKYS